MKLNRASLDRNIRWTSSKFNVYRKSEVIDKIMSMNPGDEFTFNCGNYSEGGTGYGFYYTVFRFEDVLFLRNDNTNQIIKFNIPNNKLD